MSTTTPASAARMREVAESFHEPFYDGDLGHVDRILSPDWVNHPRNPHEAPGREGWKGTVQWIRSVFPDIRFTIEELLVIDDKVVIRSIARATHTGELAPGAPVSGKKVAFNALEIHRFDGEQIIESWHIQDYYALMAQIGAIENAMGADIDPYPAWS